uniref:Keratin 15 n=1 Tax=Cyprinus carpio TaxID=7962 RepID=A0A8C1ZA16_CYPCA
MSVRRSSKTFTTRSVLGSSSSGALVMNGVGSSGASLSFGGQNYGSSGGFGGRISRSLSTSSLTTAGYEVTFHGNEKQTMQNLNDRLASYLERVHTLEQANKKFELQIKEFYDNKRPLQSKDMSAYFKTISELRAQINSRFVENAKLRLSLDNTKLAAEDFQLKYETEMNLRLVVEADSARLRGVLGEIKLSIGDLENQLAGVKEELLYIKKNHEEELASMRSQMTGSVNVEVDAAPQEDLNRVMSEIREQYEGVAAKNRRELEAWFQTKSETLTKEVAASTETLQVSKTEINELRHTLQGLEIELQSELSKKAGLEGTLADTEGRYSMQLTQLQVQVTSLEEQIVHLKGDIDRQSQEYNMLLDIKTRLEMEIAEYRRLLDGGATSFTTTGGIGGGGGGGVSFNKTIMVKTIEEDIVDGKVVSSTTK